MKKVLIIIAVIIVVIIIIVLGVKIIFHPEISKEKEKVKKLASKNYPEGKIVEFKLQYSDWSSTLRDIEDDDIFYHRPTFAKVTIFYGNIKRLGLGSLYACTHCWYRDFPDFPPSLTLAFMRTTSITPLKSASTPIGIVTAPRRLPKAEVRSAII